MIAWVRREFAEHPVRSMAVLAALYTLIIVNLKLFAPGGPWWRGWGDQKHYLESARAFMAFDLDPARHWYPLPYALSGAPFAWMPAPFVPINIACFALAFAGFRRVCLRLGVGNGAAILLFLATTLLDWRIGKLWIEPWSTTLSTALVWLALAQAGDWMAGEGRRPWLLGGLLMLAAMVRPADVAIGAVVAPFALWRPVVRDRRIDVLLKAAGGALAVLAAYVLLYLAIYGWQWSGYILLSRAYGFSFADLAWNAYVLLIEPAPWFPGEHGVLREMPWLIFALAGAVVAVLALRGAARGLLLCLALSGLAYCVLLFAYVDLVPVGLWRFNNIHYFKWLFPMAGLMTWLLVRHFDRRAGIVLAAIVALTGLRFEAVPAAPGAPAKAVAFEAPKAPWIDIYWARSVIADREGSQRSPLDYHQLLLPDGRVLAVAFKRDFAGDERWHGVTPPGIDFPKSAGRLDVTLPGPWPRVPVARYATRLTYGYPCWLPPFPCAR